MFFLKILLIFLYSIFCFVLKNIGLSFQNIGGFKLFIACSNDFFFFFLISLIFLIFDLIMLNKKYFFHFLKLLSLNNLFVFILFPFNASSFKLIKIIIFF